MPAPSSMFGRQFPQCSSHHSAQTSAISNNGHQREITSDTTSRTASAPTEHGTPSCAARIDEVFVSRPIGEIKTILWEIKDFDRVCRHRVERAMNFEFEMGRLGSMERHLPRRSRWRVMFDVENHGSVHVPAIRVLQLSPENKIIFYKLDACILETSEFGTEGAHHKMETDFRTPNNDYKEGLNDSKSFENAFCFQCGSLNGNVDLMDHIRKYISEGSLFIQVKVEILEDATT